MHSNNETNADLITNYNILFNILDFTNSTTQNNNKKFLLTYILTDIRFVKKSKYEINTLIMTIKTLQSNINIDHNNYNELRLLNNKRK